MFAHEGAGRLAVGRGTDHLDAVGQAEQGYEPLSDNRLVVGHDHTEWPLAHAGTVARTVNVWPSLPAVSSPPASAARSRMPVMP